MVNELKKELEELKKYYDDGIMVSMRESIAGASLCKNILSELEILDQEDISDQGKIDKLYDYVNKKNEILKEESAYESLMSASGYDSPVIKEIKKVIEKYCEHRTR